MKLYISGPMTSLPQFNYPAFNEAAAFLRTFGHIVFNPAETAGGDTSKSRAYYMRIDIPAVMGAEGVVVLPGWQKSRGARLEVEMARQLDIPLYVMCEENVMAGITLMWPEIGDV